MCRGGSDDTIFVFLPRPFCSSGLVAIAGGPRPRLTCADYRRWRGHVPSFPANAAFHAYRQPASSCSRFSVPSWCARMMIAP